MLGLKQRAPPKRAGSYGHSTASGRSGGTTSSKESKWETEDIVLMVIIAVVVLLVVVAIAARRSRRAKNAAKNRKSAEPEPVQESDPTKDLRMEEARRMDKDRPKRKRTQDKDRARTPGSGRRTRRREEVIIDEDFEDLSGTVKSSHMNEATKDSANEHIEKLQATVAELEEEISETEMDEALRKNEAAMRRHWDKIRQLEAQEADELKELEGVFDNSDARESERFDMKKVIDDLRRDMAKLQGKKSVDEEEVVVPESEVEVEPEIIQAQPEPVPEDETPQEESVVEKMERLQREMNELLGEIKKA